MLYPGHLAQQRHRSASYLSDVASLAKLPLSALCPGWESSHLCDGQLGHTEVSQSGQHSTAQTRWGPRRTHTLQLIPLYPFLPKVQRLHEFPRPRGPQEASSHSSMNRRTPGHRPPLSEAFPQAGSRTHRLTFLISQQRVASPPPFQCQCTEQVLNKCLSSE